MRPGRTLAASGSHSRLLGRTIGDAVTPQLVGFALCGLLAALMRLAPHPPNFTPIAALALLAGSQIRNRAVAVSLPLLIMAGTDCFLGMHATLPFVYASFVLIVLLGRMLGNSPGVAQVVLAALAASALFFLVSNLGHWLIAGYYPRTPHGLASCLGAALPFLPYTVGGDLFFAMCFFGGWQVATRARRH